MRYRGATCPDVDRARSACYLIVVRLFVVLIALALAANGCHHEPQPHHPKDGELPPLPPASGTPIGYLLDASTDLKLTDAQLTKLKDIDESLAARNASIDTQLRQYKHQEEEENGPPQKGQKPKRHNMAPGAAAAGKVTIDENKLTEARKSNDREALKAAFALLDPTQQVAARKLLEDHGFDAPGSQKKVQREDDDAGTPLPGEP